MPYQLASDCNLKVELGGKPEEIKITRPSYPVMPLKNNKKLIRINPKKINVPPVGVPPPGPPGGLKKSENGNGFSKTTTVSFATLATPKPPTSKPSEPPVAPVQKPEKRPVSFLELPQDKKATVESRSDDDSGSDSDR